jgi:putative membrane-bound dehydrogenase-like protein
LGALLIVGAALFARAAEPPRVANHSYKLELVASEPDIVTPIGLAFDHQGRLLVVESHTHQRPQEYLGPAGDRIRMLADSDGDGRLDRWSTFAEGFKNAMNLLVRPDGAVYVVTRQDVQLLRDTDGDGVADDSKTILKLETKDDYPHDGLESISLTSDGHLLIGMGENHGMAFRLVGSDGSAVKGEGEGGTIFRCTPDGANVQRWAIGFWNPFGLCQATDQHIFAVDNDPDACPPCRLVDVVPGGDYGFRFRYGRSGIHPLQAWNGELPGTLPLICGVGEAPTALVPLNGKLWVTSWGDHRIDYYTLSPRGASFAGQREIVVQGDDDFRPTGMAAAPDGSLYFGDWIRRDYPVHGHGKIWHLTVPRDATKHPPARAASAAVPQPETARAQSSSATELTAELDRMLTSSDPFVRAAAVWQYSKRDDLESLISAPASDALVRLGRLGALRLQGTDDATATLTRALADDSPDVRLFAVRWIADDHITALRDQLARLLDAPQPNNRYYLAVLAAIDWLDNEPKLPSAGITDGLLTRELKNDSRSPQLKTLALSMLSPTNDSAMPDLLHQFLHSEYEPLRVEAVRAYSQQSDTDRFGILAMIASDPNEREAVRAESLAGLAAAADEYRELLTKFASDQGQPTLGKVAAQVLRLAHITSPPDEQKPPATDLADWNKLLEQPGDAASGRRLFFSPIGARCSVCHQVESRGGRIGPDLTLIGRTNSRERVIASILQPSQEIAPEFQSWLLVTKDGKTMSGFRLQKAGDDGVEDYADATGKKFSLRSDEIETREASTASIMPEGLEKLVSIDDLRDLVTYLMSTSDAGKSTAR